MATTSTDQPVNTIRINAAGTLHPADATPDNLGTITPGSVDAIRHFMAGKHGLPGMAVVVYTELDPEVVAGWLREQGVEAPITTGSPDDWRVLGTILVTGRDIRTMMRLGAGRVPFDWAEAVRGVDEVGIPGYNRRI